MADKLSLLWAILLLPVVGFLILAFAGTRLEKALGRRVVGAIAVLPVAISFVLGVLVTMGLDKSIVHAVTTGPEWINILGLRVPFELTADPLSMTMVLIITGIGSLIFLYSTGYMATEREYSRFFTYLNLFVASMLLLVLGNNLVMLFIGWEGVGLCSYLLIGFWYQDLANAKAANKAFIVNRIGDWGLMLGMFLIVVLVATGPKSISDGRYLSYDSMLPALTAALQANPALATAVGLLLFIGAAGKSAQFPLYLWLPDAMAGPTPVSALIHAATMVTSGVVLLNRMHVVYELSPVASAIVCGVGAFTALFAAVIAFGQTDIKKVLAYSTVSQLGFMFIGVGAGAYWAGMFHVTTHAFFKALLFLGAGAVIHAMAHNQDLRNYGNLRKYLPITTWTMVIGWLAISAIAIPGVFGLSGYYSKEALLGAALGNDRASVPGLNVSLIAGWVGLFTAMLTAAYMTRLTLLTFFGTEERWRKIEAHAEHAHEDEPLATPVAETADPHGFYLAAPTETPAESHHDLDADHVPHEVPPSMWVPLAVLAALSAFGGFLLHQGNAFEKWLEPVTTTEGLKQISTEPTGVPLAWLSLAAALLGLAAGWVVYSKGLPKREAWDEAAWNPFRLRARDQFGYDATLTDASVQGGGDLARTLWKGFDERVIDRAVDGLGGLAAGIASRVSAAQLGLVRSYALLMLLGGIFIIGYFTYAAALAPHTVGGR